MSTHDLIIDNQNFPSFRADLNNALQALGSSSISATAPTVTYAGQFWVDTSANVLRIRNTANTGWVLVGSMTLDRLGNQQNLGYTPVQQGGGNLQNNNKIYVGWDGSELRAQVDTVDLGKLVTENNLLTKTSYGFGTKSLAAYGFQRFPSGLFMQWGTNVTTTDVNGAGIIAFPLAFPDTLFTVTVTNGDYLTFADRIFSTNFGDYKTFFGVRLQPTPPQGSSFRVNWTAIGK